MPWTNIAINKRYTFRTKNEWSSANFFSGNFYQQLPAQNLNSRETRMTSSFKLSTICMQKLLKLNTFLVLRKNV